MGIAVVNVENRTLSIADNLNILRGMDSEAVDLIYLDQPFNTNEEHKAPIGTHAEGQNSKTSEQIWHGQIAK